MLSPTTHPAGSQALLHGRPGTIRQWLADGAALFFPQRGSSYRAHPSELQPMPELPPFERWAAERVASVQGIVATPADQVFADYCDWCVRNTVDQAEVLSFWRFRVAMYHAGYVATKRLVKRDGEIQHRLRNCWHLSLHAAPVGNI